MTAEEVTEFYPRVTAEAAESVRAWWEQEGRELDNAGPLESRVEYGYRTPSGSESWDGRLTRKDALRHAGRALNLVAIQRTVYVGPTQEITP